MNGPEDRSPELSRARQDDVGLQDVELHGRRPCAEHSDTAAEYECCECGQALCQRCVTVGSHLIVCRLCGERAVALDEVEQPLNVPTPFERSQRSRDAFAEAPVRPLDVPGLWLINHLVVPIATICMVAALLFFLLDVRSVFLGGSAALKWVGFWFVTATVLIARYGHTSSDAARQGCYTLALSGATILAMTVAPWESSQDGPMGLIVNIAIVLAVWRFASRLVAALSLEKQSAVSKPRLYGVERQELEAWRRERGQTRSPAKVDATRSDAQRAKSKKSAALNRPNAAVTRLALLGLIIFALGEPLLLAGPPAAGERALAAMIVFLFATGLVLACGTSVGTLQRVRSLGGEVSLTALPGRTFAAALVMIMVLAIALAMPGVEHQGSGELAPVRTDDGRAGGSDPGDATSGTETESSGDTTGGERANPESSSQPKGSQSNKPQRDAGKSTTGTSLSASLISFLAELGQWLRWPFYLVVGLMILYGLWRMRSQLGHLGRQWAGLFRGLIGRLSRGLRSLFGRRKTASTNTFDDPLANLDGLRQQEPHDAVLAAYTRLLVAFDHLGHPRHERHTPYEFLATLPARMRPLCEPAHQLTDRYVRAAYSSQAVDTEDRSAVIAALERLRDEIERQRTKQVE